jgi:hypothetical protein
MKVRRLHDSRCPTPICVATRRRTRSSGSCRRCNYAETTESTKQNAARRRRVIVRPVGQHGRQFAYLLRRCCLLAALEAPLRARVKPAAACFVRRCCLLAASDTARFGARVKSAIA